VTVGEGAVWVADSAAGVVHRLEPRPEAPAASEVTATRAAAATQQVARSLATVGAEATADSATGARVDVGGYRLFIRCTGQGSPPVVLDAGAGGDSTDWAAVQPEVARFTRVCAYDRADRGRSDAGPLPSTSRRMVDDLRALLSRAGVTGPYILVGQSFGGMNMQLYARLHPGEAAGLVLVDAVHEEGYLDPAVTPCPQPACNGVDLAESARQVRAAPPLAAIPLVVLAHGRPLANPAWEERWPAWQRDLEARSPRGQLVVVAGSGHNIHREQPGAVIAAIREVAEQARR
jgi:pimeloyl-ACP methyl ester carboxylesterase